MAGKPRGTRYTYAQVDYHFRMSIEAHCLLRDMATDLDASLRACLLATLLQKLDPHKTCPDWETLPGVFREG